MYDNAKNRPVPLSGVNLLRALSICALIAVAALAGCAGPEAADAEVRRAVEALRFGPITVQPTPSEPFEKPGNSVLDWSGSTFGIHSDDPHSGLRPITILADGVAYTTNEQIGWFSVEYPGDLSAGHHGSPLLAVWDLPQVVRDPALRVTMKETEQGQNFTFVGALPRGGRTYTIHLELGARNGEVVWGRMFAEDVPEPPFTFWKGGSLGFALVPPAKSKPIEEVIPAEKLAGDAHTTLIQLIRDYAAKRGSVPDKVDAQTLQLELLTSGKSWPTNPFDGEPLRSEKKSGHFIWVKCSEKAGFYAGYGWDTILKSQQFTKACPA